MTRRQIAGAQALQQALAQGDPVRRVLVAPTAGPELEPLLERARSAGARVTYTSAADIERMSALQPAPQLLALLGPSPECDLGSLLSRGGVCWLLHRASYPSNVGFAVRTAEVSGADGLVVDARFNHEERSRVSHVSMGADRALPIVWADSKHAVEEARRRNVRVVAIEDVGSHSLFEVDLTGPLLLILGNERTGIDPELLAHVDLCVHIPVYGFVPSYNLQAALSIVAGERMRQQAALG